METTIQTKSFAFCGDDRAKNSVYLGNIPTSIINGMPINDHLIKSMLKHKKHKAVIFFSPGFPLMGHKLIKYIKHLKDSNVNIRLIAYRHRQDCRGFYGDDEWKNLSDENINLLFENWAEMLNYYYQEYNQMIILPLAAHYFDTILDLPNKAMQIISQFEKTVDLSPLDEVTEENYKDKFGNLSEIGFAKIKDNILKWVEK